MLENIKRNIHKILKESQKTGNLESLFVNRWMKKAIEKFNDEFEEFEKYCISESKKDGEPLPDLGITLINQEKVIIRHRGSFEQTYYIGDNKFITRYMVLYNCLFYWKNINTSLLNNFMIDKPYCIKIMNFIKELNEEIYSDFRIESDGGKEYISFNLNDVSQTNEELLKLKNGIALIHEEWKAKYSNQEDKIAELSKEMVELKAFFKHFVEAINVKEFKEAKINGNKAMNLLKKYGYKFLKITSEVVVGIAVTKLLNW